MWENLYYFFKTQISSGTTPNGKMLNRINPNCSHKKFKVNKLTWWYNKNDNLLNPIRCPTNKIEHDDENRAFNNSAKRNTCSSPHRTQMSMFIDMSENRYINEANANQR